MSEKNIGRHGGSEDCCGNDGDDDVNSRGISQTGDNSEPEGFSSLTEKRKSNGRG